MLGLLKQLMIFGNSGLQGLPTRVTLFLWAFGRQGATGVPLFTTWDSIAGLGRAPIPENISGRKLTQVLNSVSSVLLSGFVFSQLFNFKPYFYYYFIPSWGPEPAPHRLWFLWRKRWGLLWDWFQTIFMADSAKLGKGEILQRYRNVIVHHPCCCLYFQPTSRQSFIISFIVKFMHSGSCFSASLMPLQTQTFLRMFPLRL